MGKKKKKACVSVQIYMVEEEQYMDCSALNMCLTMKLLIL